MQKYEVIELKKVKLSRICLDNANRNEWGKFSAMIVLDKQQSIEAIEVLKSAIVAFQPPIYDTDKDRRPGGEAFEEKYKGAYIFTANNNDESEYLIFTEDKLVDMEKFYDVQVVVSTYERAQGLRNAFKLKMIKDEVTE